MHCHHRNGVITDNRPENLQALCLLCHAKQPAHNHIKPSGKARKTIEQLRVKQKMNG